MNTFGKKLRNLGTMIAVVGAMYTTQAHAQNTETSTIKEKQDKIELSLNATSYAGMKVQDGSINSRLEQVIGMGATKDNLTLRYDALHVLSDLDFNTYFGSNMVSLNKKGIPVAPCVVMMTTKNGIVDTQYGIIDKSLVKKLGFDFGYSRLTANNDKATLTLICGEKFENGLSGYVWSKTTQPFDKKIQNITWVELSKKISPHISGYVRGEVTNAQFENTVAVLGIYLTK